MKIKRLPEDFRVEELTDRQPGRGPFAMYRLTKRSLGTPEAVDEILAMWQRPRRDVAYAGLKDRHAQTTQFVTVRDGPRRDAARALWRLTYLGQTDAPFAPQDIRANRFEIVLRDLAERDEEGGNTTGGPSAEGVLRAAREAAADGVPNYFDDQRFGSLGKTGTFVAVPWCLGDYERALWLALADANVHDRPGDREQKELLRRHWGDWAVCKQALAKSHRRSIVTYLADRPGDYRGALARVRVDLRGLYLAAFQSAVWNELLAAWLRRELGAAGAELISVPLRLGPFPFYRTLSEPARRQILSARIPLPSARNKEAMAPWDDLLTPILRRYGIELRQMRAKYPRDSFFSKGDRAAVLLPSGLTAESAEDELHPGRFKAMLRFELPRGGYATMLIKRLVLGAAGALNDLAEDGEMVDEEA